MPPSKLPAWVTKRDGRLVPFEADKISQALYAATEDLGRPSAFLARELTDGILHFLGQDLGPDFGQEHPTTAQIAELTAKVVRELGQPRLAQAYTERRQRHHQESAATVHQEKLARAGVVYQFATIDPRDQVVRGCLERYNLHAVFSRDLAAAHAEGLITLTGLDRALDLATLVLDAPEVLQSGEAWSRAWKPVHKASARVVVVDSPEWILQEETSQRWLRTLHDAAGEFSRKAIINLNTLAPPAWAQQPGEGPLFGPSPESAAPEKARQIQDLLLKEYAKLDQATADLRLDWHLSEPDFTFAGEQRLAQVATLALEHGGIAFTLDRPRRPLALAEGVDRQHPAAFLEVGLHLPRLLKVADSDSGRFLEKLPSLARMGVRAGVQKRNHLRSRGADLDRGFLLPRARLVLIPIGLDHVVRTLLGQGIAAGKLALELGKQLVQTLWTTLCEESLTANLEIALAGPAWPQDLGGDGLESVPGLTWAGTATVGQKELHAAGTLHGIAGMGTVVLPRDLKPQELVALLQFAWKRTELARVGLPA